jgi:CRISPR-associated endonuclease/helicase Cas3
MADAAVLELADQLLTSIELKSGLPDVIRSIIALERTLLPDKLPDAMRLAAFKIGLLQRLVFSILVDADRIDSADFESNFSARARPAGKYVPWATLCRRAEDALSDMSGATGCSQVNRVRQDISRWCLDAADRTAGIYTLSVPTGGGKTLASLRFALNHARVRGLDRIVYVVPYTSIIDQNADVARAVLEPDGADAGRVVLEHHSNLLADRRTGLNSLLAENWDAPVVYTTSVQLLEALFGSGTRSVRRLHQLARAVVVFDEIQTLPVRCVHMFNNAANFLVEHCRSTVLLCTATQPLLDKVDPARGAVRMGADREIVPDVSALFDQLARVEVINAVRPEGWSSANIATLAIEQIQHSGSCLIITNTKRAALEIHSLLSGATAAPVYHLSTSMCPCHRREVLGVVRRLLAAAMPVACVSTQLIEAGVDVDFGSVVRLLAGLDSIAQAAGRCNRNGRRSMGRVWVVNPTDENLSMLADIRIGRDIARRVLDELAVQHSSGPAAPIGPEALARFYDYYFHRRAEEMSYTVEVDGVRDTLLELLSTNSKGAAAYRKAAGKDSGLALRQAFGTAASLFEAIETDAQGVLVPYNDEARDLIRIIQGTGDPAATQAALRSAQQYTVNVLRSSLQRLLDSGKAHILSDRGAGVIVLHEGIYSREYGLADA